MEYENTSFESERQPVDVGDLLRRLESENLANPDEYKKIIELENEGFKQEYRPSHKKPMDFFRKGFSGIENSVEKAKEFAILQNGYYDRIRAEANPKYRMLVRAKNAALSYMGKEAPPMPTLSELIDVGLEFVEDVTKELTPAREATLTLAGMMADYKNNRVVKKLCSSAQYRVKIEEKIRNYECLAKEVDEALTGLEMSDENYYPLFTAKDNISRYLIHWSGRDGMARGDNLFKGPEVESVGNYEFLCWTTLQFCNIFKNNVDNIYEHLIETKPVHDGIGATSMQLGALEGVVYKLAEDAMKNVVIIGEASDNIARIALRPELDEKFPNDLASVLREFVVRIKSKKMERDIVLDQLAANILKTKGYFSRNGR